MLHITYENEIGRLDFSGGSGKGAWRILEIDGLGLAEKSYQTVTYPGGAGQRTVSETAGARVITIQCDVNCIHGTYKSTAGNAFEASKALKILNEPGALFIGNGGRNRKIEARCTQAAQGQRYGGYLVFAMQFICDYPYFEDPAVQTIPIFKRENLIGCGVRWFLEPDASGKDSWKSEPLAADAFQLPCIFSRRVSEANILNAGDVEAEPVIRIRMQGGEYSGESGESGTLAIHNLTTCQKIELNLADAGKVSTVTIDIHNRKIFSQDEENLIHYLAPTSFLSDFWLQKGQNLIQVDNYLSDSCSVVCEFSNKYVEAVIG